MITTVLFDLDGTLLPMDQDVFVKAYFGGICKKLAPAGYAPEQMVDTIWRGTAAMVKNDGSKTNEETFWAYAASVHGNQILADKKYFDAFYEENFNGIKSVCGFQPMAAEIVRFLKGKGLRVALATNPIFPARATQWRIQWSGLQPEDFELYTTYENCSYCKPNLGYYRDVLARLGVKPEECLMVGNDVGEDMVTEQMGMKVFLLTDCLINKSGEDISRYPNGDFNDLKNFLGEL